MRTRASHRSLIAVASVVLGTLSAAPAFAQPVANPDSYATNEDTTLTIGGNGVRSNDNLAGLGNNVDAILVTGPTRGTLTTPLGQNGNFAYTPSANFNGTDSFTYRLRYPTNNFSNTTTVTIVVNPVNDPPTGVVNRSYTTTEDVPLSVPAPGLLAGVADPEGAAVTAAIVTNPSATAGTLSPNSNGAFTFTPAAGFSGNATFTYRAVDAAGGQSATATVTIAVASVNDAPVANADTYNATEDTVLTIAARGVLANDTDPDGSTQTQALTAVIATRPPTAEGTVTLNSNGSFTFQPAQNFSGATTFTYNARDNATPPATSATPATVTINVAARNDAPTALADAFATTENVPLVVPPLGILANDTDVDSTALTALLVASVAASSGTLSPITNGGFTYTPARGFSGTATFTYRAVDDATPPLQSAVATVTITVTGVNDAPVAAADVYAATEDTVLTVAAPGVLGNDTDPDASTTLTALLVAQPAHGSVTLNPNGSFTYSPARDYQGPDVFRYRASDNGTPPLQSNEANVTLNVNSVNDPPRFAPGITAIPNQTVTENVALAPFSLAQFFVDPEASPLTFSATGLPTGLTVTSAGVLAGIPAVAATGASNVTVRVSDGQSQFSSTFTIAVLAAGRTDLALSVAAAPSPAVIAQTVTWTFTIANSSPVEAVPALSLQVVFTGLASFAATPTPGCTAAPQQADRTTVTCSGASAPAAGSAAIVVAGSSTQPGEVVATATVAIAGGIPIDPTPANDTAVSVVNFAQTLPAGPAQTLPATGVLSSASGDFNGDGFIDLAVAAGGGGGTLIYPNVVDPGSSTRRALATQPIALGDAGASVDIAAADLNGDGALDLIVAKVLGPSVALQNPNNGTFAFVAMPTSFGAAGDAGAAVAARDLNGDGRVDVVLANAGVNRVFMNQANGTFAAIAGPLGSDSRDVVLADLAGDAALELVFANATRDATVHSFDAAANRYQETLLSTGAATSVAAADFDGNGRTDLVVGGAQSKLVLLNTTAPGAPLSPFTSVPSLGVAQTADLLATDADADGDVDIVGINASGSHQVFANSGTGQFTLRAQQFASRDARKATAAKLSVDDRVDVAVISASRLDVFYNDGAGNFGAGDTAAPVIQRRGPASVELTVESPYADEGATAADSVDGDLTARIKVDNPVNPAVVGTYTVTYNVVDNSGNAAAPVTRTVRVGVRSGTGGGGGGAFGLVALLALAVLVIIGKLRTLTARSDS